MEGFQDIEHFVKSLYAAIKKKIPTKVSQLTNDAGYKTTDTNTTYKLSKSGSTVTLTGSDGSTTSVTDSNTTYSSLKNPYSLTIQNNGTTVASYDGSTAKTANFTNVTTSANGLMSAADKSKLDGIGAGSNVKSVNSKTGAVTLTKSDIGLGSVANLDQSKAIKSITRSGTTFTATALDGTKTTFTQQDTNTTYPVATTSTDGLMSKSDKTKLDGIDPSAITTNAANIKKNADAISAEVTRAKKAEEANTQLTNDLKTGLTSGTVKVAKATVADSASSLGKVSTYQTEIPDNGGRRKYLLMYDITDWISAKSNASTRAFDGYFFSRRSGGYVGTNYTGNLSIVASYNGVNSDGSPIKSDNGISLRLRTTSSTYVPRILHQKSNDKYYLSLMTGGSGRDLILFGIFQGTFIGTWINNEVANNSNGTLPSDYEEYSDGFHSIPYEKAVCDKNGKDITEYLVAATYADGAFTFTRGNGGKTVLTIPDAVSNTVNSHIANKSNPHGVTKAQVGLGSVANLDQSKAIKSITRSGTTFTATALDGTTSTFTQQDNNTTYGIATSSSDGLMSKTDKAKLDGIASSPSMLTNLGSTAAANVFQASPRPGVTGVLPIANGGTGASSLEGLRSNLDIETTLDTTCNILADNWVQDKTSLLYSNTVSVAGVKEGYVYDIDAYKGNLTTSAEVEAYNNDFSCISGGYAEAEEGKITFTVVDKPAANITVRVKGTQVITTEETQSTEINNQKSTITDLQSKLAKITDKIYPVGSIYISVDSTSPASLFGGTWERIKDRFLLASGDTYSAGNTGGEAQHTLTVDEMPSHAHNFDNYISGIPDCKKLELDKYTMPVMNTLNPDDTKGAGKYTNAAGNSKPHNNMPPYITAYMWKRVA